MQIPCRYWLRDAPLICGRRSNPSRSPATSFSVPGTSRFDQGPGRTPPGRKTASGPRPPAGGPQASEGPFGWKGIDERNVFGCYPILREVQVRKNPWMLSGDPPTTRCHPELNQTSTCGVVSGWNNAANRERTASRSYPVERHSPTPSGKHLCPKEPPAASPARPNRCPAGPYRLHIETLG